MQPIRNWIYSIQMWSKSTSSCGLEEIALPKNGKRYQGNWTEE
jgi:hypothetical protein